MITAKEAKEITSNVRKDYQSIINKLINSKLSKELCRTTKDAANRGLTRGSFIFDASKYKEIKYLPINELSTIGRGIVNFLEDLGYSPVYFQHVTGASCELKIVWHWGGN